jgi:hypothetical protein
MAQEMVPAWLSLDRDPASRAQVEQLAAAARWEELEELLCRRLEFGTAGLRGKMVRPCAALHALRGPAALGGAGPAGTQTVPAPRRRARASTA